jgi:hypothetical protein
MRPANHRLLTGRIRRIGQKARAVKRVEVLLGSVGILFLLGAAAAILAWLA